MRLDLLGNSDFDFLNQFDKMTLNGHALRNVGYSTAI